MGLLLFVWVTLAILNVSVAFFWFVLEMESAKPKKTNETEITIEEVKDRLDAIGFGKLGSYLTAPSFYIVVVFSSSSPIEKPRGELNKKISTLFEDEIRP